MPNDKDVLTDAKNLVNQTTNTNFANVLCAELCNKLKNCVRLFAFIWLCDIDSEPNNKHKFC